MGGTSSKAAAQVAPATSVELAEVGAKRTLGPRSRSSTSASSPSNSNPASPVSDSAATADKPKHELPPPTVKVNPLRAVAAMVADASRLRGPASAQRSTVSTDTRIAGATDSEHLDHDTWEDRRYQYRWPDLEMAEQYGRDRKIGDGRTPYCISQADMNRSLPFGMVLYFRFLTLLTILFACLFVIVIPELVFTWSSNHLQDEMATSSAFQRVFAFSTIGNLGTDRLKLHERDLCFLNSTFSSDPRCGVANVTISGNDIDLVTVSHMFTVLDAVCVVFFFVFTVVVSNDNKRLKRSVDIDQTTVRDFAVVVENLPKEAQKIDVQAHFEELYRLDRKFEWRGKYRMARRYEVPISDEEKRRY